MLDWDTLITGQRDKPGQDLHPETGQTIPAYPGEIPANHACRDSLEANNGGHSGVTIPVIPVIPAEKTREGRNPGACGGDAADNFAQQKATASPENKAFQPNAEAVVMVLAVCEKVGADTHELAVALESLRTMSPGEQVRRWNSTCLAQGIKPWLLIYPKAPDAGMDCMGCRHIDSVHEFIRDLGRRRFTWSCELGYPLHTHAHGGERVLVAPPECQGWERWRPAR